MPWWGWLLLGWAVTSAACSVWWGHALANADTQDAARKITENVPNGDSQAA